MLYFFSSDKKINPNMYKEYLIRYPSYSVPLILQMIEIASQPDTKLHKKASSIFNLLIQ